MRQPQTVIENLTSTIKLIIMTENKDLHFPSLY